MTWLHPRSSATPGLSLNPADIRPADYVLNTSTKRVVVDDRPHTSQEEGAVAAAGSKSRKHFRKKKAESRLLALQDRTYEDQRWRVQRYDVCESADARTLAPGEPGVSPKDKSYVLCVVVQPKYDVELCLAPAPDPTFHTSQLLVSVQHSCVGFDPLPPHVTALEVSAKHCGCSSAVVFREHVQAAQATRCWMHADVLAGGHRWLLIAMMSRRNREAKVLDRNDPILSLTQARL